MFTPGGLESVQLRVAEQYILEFGNLAKHNNTMILPANLSDVVSITATAMTVVRSQTPEGPAPRPTRLTSPVESMPITSHCG